MILFLNIKVNGDKLNKKTNLKLKKHEQNKVSVNNKYIFSE